jgi:hypothetical protein
MSPPPSSVTQVVDADGAFLAPAMDAFVASSGLARARPTDYQVVAVMGPQSSGKSTLLNALVRRWEGGGRLFILSTAVCVGATLLVRPSGVWVERVRVPAYV